jgi:hypothetical protein
MKKILISFGDRRLKKSNSRLRKQALGLNIYDEIYIYNENDLNSEFRSKFASKLNEKNRGFGYWCWKPQVVLQVMEKCKNGDVIQYIDLGCHLNSNGILRLEEYFEITKKSRQGLLAFQAIPPQDMKEYDGRKLPDMQEKKWVKADLLNYFKLEVDSDLLETQTIAAGVFFMVKNEFTINFLKSWISIFENDFSLLDDTPSVIPNQKAFVEHRHDQSIFSIMCKLNSIECISFYETWMPDRFNIKKSDFKLLDKYPIHVRRDKSLSIKDFFKKIFLRFSKGI